MTAERHERLRGCVCSRLFVRLEKEALLPNGHGRGNMYHFGPVFVVGREGDVTVVVVM